MDLDEDLKKQLDDQRPLEEVLREYDEEVARKREERRRELKRELGGSAGEKGGKTKKKKMMKGSRGGEAAAATGVGGSVLFPWLTYTSLFFERWLSVLPRFGVPLLLALAEPRLLHFALSAALSAALGAFLLSSLWQRWRPWRPSGDVRRRLLPLWALHGLSTLLLLAEVVLLGSPSSLPFFPLFPLLLHLPLCLTSALSAALAAAAAPDGVSLHFAALGAAERRAAARRARLISACAVGLAPALLLLAATALPFRDPRDAAVVGAALAIVGAMAFGAIAAIAAIASARDPDLRPWMALDAVLEEGDDELEGEPSGEPKGRGADPADGGRWRWRMVERVRLASAQPSPSALGGAFRGLMGPIGSIGLDGSDRSDGGERSEAPPLLAAFLLRFSALSAAALPLQVWLISRGSPPAALAALALLPCALADFAAREGFPFWLFSSKRAERSLRMLSWAPALTATAAAAALALPGLFAASDIVFLAFAAASAVAAAAAAAAVECAVRRREGRAKGEKMRAAAWAPRAAAAQLGEVAMLALALALGHAQALPFVFIPSLFAAFLASAILLFWTHLSFRDKH